MERICHPILNQLPVMLFILQYNAIPLPHFHLVSSSFLTERYWVWSFVFTWIAGREKWGWRNWRWTSWFTWSCDSVVPVWVKTLS